MHTSVQDNYLEVNLKKMLPSLQTVFTLPRNYQTDPGMRQSAADFISRKMGKMGLVVGIQQFTPSRFYKQVSWELL